MHQNETDSRGERVEEGGTIYYRTGRPQVEAAICAKERKALPPTKQRILVVGCGMLDVWKIGKLGPENPENSSCPIVKQPTVTHEVGGAANVAAWLAGKTGALVDLLVTHGYDGVSLLFRQLCLERHGVVPLEALRVPDGSITLKERLCFTDTDRQTVQQLARLDHDRNESGNPAYQGMLGELLGSRDSFARYDLIVAVDYGKGIFNRRDFDRWKTALIQANTPLVVNSKYPEKWSGWVDVLVCNEKERAAWRKETGSDDIVATPTPFAVVTKAACGSTGWHRGKEVLSLQAIRPPVLRSVVGAGDAYLAGLAASLLHCLGGQVDERPEAMLRGAMTTGARWAAESLAAFGCGAPTRVQGDKQ